MIGRRVVDHLKLAEETAFKTGEEGVKSFIAKTHDHAAYPSACAGTNLWDKQQPESILQDAPFGRRHRRHKSPKAVDIALLPKEKYMGPASISPRATNQ